jgi:hypothetical protein
VTSRTSVVGTTPGRMRVTFLVSSSGAEADAGWPAAGAVTASLTSRLE